MLEYLNPFFMNEKFLFQGNTSDQYKDTIEAQLEQPATQKKQSNK